MIRFDYAKPIKSNGVTAVGFILRVLAGMALIIVLGADYEPLIRIIL